MKYSALSTEEKQHFFLSGLLCSLAALVLVFTVLSCRSGPVVTAAPASLSDSAYQADLYKRPPLSASSAVSGQNQQIDADHLPEPDLIAFLVHSDAMESNPDTPAEGTEFLPDVTVLSRLLIISQLDLPEPLLPDQLPPRDSVRGEVRAAAEPKRTETDRPAEAMVGEAKALLNPAAAGTAPALAAEAPTAGTPSSAAAAASAATTEPTKTTLVPLVVPPVVEAEPSLLNVSAYSNQAFILRFSGAGWTFVGDQDGQSGIQFRTRQFENNEVIFSLAPLQAGEYLLLFRRQNPLNQQMESSLVAVTVSDQAPVADPAPVVPAEPASATAAAAATRPTESAANANPTALAVSDAPTAASWQAEPAASTAAAEKPVVETASTAPLAAVSADRNTGNIASPDAGTASTVPVPLLAVPVEPAPETQTEQPVFGPALAALPPELLAFARAEINANRVATGLEALNRLAILSGPLTAGQDELLYLYGLAYELDTSFRDIKLSHQYYGRVRDDYPRSRFRRLALERIAWMERHFPGLR